MPFKRLAAIPAALLLILLTGAAKVDLVSAVKVGREPHMCLTVRKVTYQPGEGSRRHRHDASVVAYVIDGAVESQVDDEPLQTFRAGDHWEERSGAEHRVSRNASATAPATFLAIMLAPRGAEEYRPCG